MTTTTSIPEPCGYCRRCAVHNDPAGCLTVEAWERENPEAAIAAIQAAGMAGGQWRIEELENIIDERMGEQAVRDGIIGRDMDPFDRAEAMGDWDGDGFAPAGMML